MAQPPLPSVRIRNWLKTVAAPIWRSNPDRPSMDRTGPRRSLGVVALVPRFTPLPARLSAVGRRGYLTCLCTTELPTVNLRLWVLVPSTSRFPCCPASVCPNRTPNQDPSPILHRGHVDCVLKVFSGLHILLGQLLYVISGFASVPPHLFLSALFDGLAIFREHSPPPFPRTLRVPHIKTWFFLIDSFYAICFMVPLPPIFHFPDLLAIPLYNYVRPYFFH